MRTRTCLLALLQATSLVHGLRVNFEGDSCRTWALGDVRLLIENEMAWANQAANTAASDVTKHYFYERFFPESLRRNPAHQETVKQKLKRIASMATGEDRAYPFKVSCNDNTEMCKSGFWAHMSDDKRLMNFCHKFFEGKDTPSRLNSCDKLDLRDAQQTRSMILIHELSHTSYAMLDTSRSLDYAYGLNGCTRLARGGFNRNTNCHGKGYPKTKTIFCPDKNDKNVEGECPPENADTNADTFSFIAAGVFFSVECKKEIPLPTERLDPAKRDNLATPTTLLRVRAPQATNGLEESQTCEAYDDAIFWDDPEPEESDGDTGGGRLEGYVHFGDSYAAGMGTGVTSGDSCRVGQNNYGDLLYKQFGDNKIPYQKKVCSGDTLTGLNRQVSEWKDPGKANVGTLSIGGNDIGFSDLVWYCIITPYTARTGESNKELCQAALIRAYGLMAEDLGDRLAAAYKSILDKSGRKDFHLYVTGYVPFFNVDTADCDKSSFHYWWGGYNPASDGRIVLLNKDLRLKMNNLVVDLNTLIDISVAGANKQHGSENVHFVDVGNRYDKHRFCEDEKVHEPAPQRSDTWFFLSGWPDVGVSGNAADQAVEQQEIGAMVEQGRVPLPNSDCDIMDINDIDPYERALCRIRETIDEDPEGPEAKYLEEANKHIKEGNVSSQAIGWFTPTRQIKTFHPRSAGMEAYAQAVRQAIAASQKF